MKVIYAVKNYHPAHAGIVAALQSDGHAVLLLYRDPRDSATKDGSNYAAVETVRVPSNRFLDSVGRVFGGEVSIPAVRALVSVIRDFSPDVVIVYAFSLQQHLIGAVGRAFGARIIHLVDKPEVVKTWSDAPRLFLKSLVTPRRRIHNGAYGEFGRSFSLGPFLGSSWLAPYPVDTDPRMRRGHVAPSGRVRVLCMGSANSTRSRMAYVLEAVARSGVSDRIDLTFFQRPWKAEALTTEVRSREAELALSPSTVRSDVTDGELRPAFGDFDLLVYPSRNNPYGHTVGEALAHGLPVLCCDSIGARILIEEGVNGSIFRTHDLDDFAEKLEGLVSDPELLGRMSEEALRRSRETHSSAAWLRTFYRVLSGESDASGAAGAGP